MITDETDKLFPIGDTTLCESHAEKESMTVAKSLLGAAQKQRFATILADPPWQFQNKTGRRSRRCRYPTSLQKQPTCISGFRTRCCRKVFR